MSDLSLGDNVRHLTAKQIRDGEHKHTGNVITNDQAYRVRQQANKDTYDCWLKDLCYLAPLFILLKKMDPNGIYILYTKPLSYNVEGAPEGARELVGFIVIPAYVMEDWWLQDYLRMMCMDFAHRKGQMLGMQATAVSKDGKNGLVRLMYSFFPVENKDAWTSISNAVSYGFKDIALFISDQTKGGYQALRLLSLSCSSICLNIYSDVCIYMQVRRKFD